MVNATAGPASSCLMALPNASGCDVEKNLIGEGPKTQCFIKISSRLERGKGLKKRRSKSICASSTILTPF